MRANHKKKSKPNTRRLKFVYRCRKWDTDTLSYTTCCFLIAGMNEEMTGAEQNIMTPFISISFRPIQRIHSTFPGKKVLHSSQQ